MASAETAADGSPSALIEPPPAAVVDTCFFADVVIETESQGDDFHATADLPVMDESLFAAATESALSTLAKDGEDPDPVEACSAESHETIESADQESVADEKQTGRRIALVVGGRRGVGTSTLAAQLASAMNGLAGEVAVQPIEECSEHLMCEAERVGETHHENITDWTVVDGGAELTPRLEQLWHSADSVTVITTTDASSVIGCYRLMKSAVARGLSLDAVGLIVNQVLDEYDAQRTGRRIRRCCEQFLNHCHREPQWIAFDSAACDDTAACGVLNVTDNELSTPVNRNVKNWADRVWSLPQIEHESN